MTPITNESLILTASLVLVFASAGLLAVAALASGAKLVTQERLQRYTQSPSNAAAGLQGAGVLRQRQLSAVGRLDALLRGSALAQDLSRELALARIPLQVGEYLLLMLVCGAVAGYVGLTLTGNPAVGIAAGLLGFLMPKFYVNYRKGQRTQQIEDQLVDVLSLCSNSLRAGWGFLQALEQVADELPPPVSEEVRQVLEEVSLGASPEDALLAFQQRIPSYDLELIITAVLIQRRVGGNLAEMMDTIAHTIRGRIQLLGEIRTITAESRMSVWLLILLPVALLAILSAVEPTYIAPLFSDPRGRMILMGAAFLEFLGVVILRRMAKIDV